MNVTEIDASSAIQGQGVSTIFTFEAEKPSRPLFGNLVIASWIGFLVMPITGILIYETPPNWLYAVLIISPILLTLIYPLTKQYKIFSGLRRARRKIMRGKFENSKTILEKIDNYNNQHPLILSWLGISYFSIGEYEKSINSFERYLEKF